MKTITDYLETIANDEGKEALLIEAAIKHPKVLEAYLRENNAFYSENEKTFVEKAPVENLELFAKKDHTLDKDNEKVFRERISPEIWKIYKGETKLNKEEKDALELPKGFLNKEEVAILKKIAEGKK